MTSISPVQGPAGTVITVTGTGFSTTMCENTVLIESSYQCPISSATAIQIVCQIGSNSTLNAKSIQNLHVKRDRQGFLSNNGLIQFQFQAQITNISPLKGSINLKVKWKLFIFSLFRFNCWWYLNNNYR